MTVVSPCTQDLMDSTHPHAVLSKLNEQRSQGLFCDVTIVVEDVKFRAHRNILAACSGYFRNALMASEAWSSGQVLELMDLKSEVFASILNFIYCSKVASTGTDDTRGLVAAGKKLGIPFLERLSEQERQSSAISKTMHQGHMTTDSNHGPVPKKTKKEPPRPEDIDLTSGPRITNAFSITEAGPGNNPFTPLVLTNGERQSPDVGQVPASCPTISCPTVINETAHALSEHSYAVSQAGEQNDGSPRDLKKFSKPPLNQNVGPLKKRHRLRGTLSRSVVPAEVPSPPPPLHVEAETEKSTTESAVEQFQIELDPPTLSPHVEDSIYIYGCEYCAEIFTNRALLTVHMDIHKRRFVSHLFCKFCDKKFMHLKRLRNHEHVCPKAISSHPETDSGEKHSVVDDIQSNPPNVDSTVAQLTTAGVPIAYIPEPLQTNQSAATRSEKPRASQRVYSCSVCKRVYVTLSSLKRHENVHSWQRAYPCHYCNKVFALAEYRTKHEIWHTGERRYQCIFCLETFMTYYILKNHQKSFHGIDPRLAMKKKSANGGLKASVYPIKLYRLLPMKFRKRRYKTYSETYSEKVEGIEEQATLSSSSLIPAFEENNIIRNPDAGSFPMPVTFMATTKMVAPVMPHISFDQPFAPDIDEGLSSDVEKCNKRGMRNTERRSSPFTNHDNSNALQKDSPIIGDEDNAHTIMNLDHISHTIPLLAKTLNTVNKLGELSAAAKRVEAMTKEILLSGTNNQTRDVMVAGKTETYIAKPACPGPSVDGGALPLCQITVKIGNEAIIRRRIKGSKLFPRKKKKSRHHMDSPGHWFSTEESSESSGIHSRAEISATKQLEMYDDPNDHETDDKLWRPYYSYKAKKKRKKWRIKHGRDKQYVFPSTSVARSATIEHYPERRCMVTNESNSASSGDTKRNVKNCSPRANYKCDICDSYFITESGLRAHIIGSHPCFCRTCGKQGPPGEAPAGGEYVCKSCMENGSCFDNTPRSPSTEKKYRCSFCPQRFVYVATKRSHEKKHQETTGKGNKIDKYPSKHSAHLDKDSEQGIKSEDEEEEISNMKCSEVGRGHLSMDKVMPKVEDINQEINQGTNSHAKGPLSPSNTDTFLPLSPTKVKHKMSKKRMVMAHHIHLASKKPEPDKDNNKCPLTRPRTDSVDIYEKGPHLFWKKDSETIGPHISMPKSEK